MRERAVGDVRALAAAEGISIDVSTGLENAIVDIEADLLARMLAPLLENGCRYGRTQFKLSLERRG